MYRVFTELTVVTHMAFILFVVLGAFLARHRPWLMVLHLGALAWAVFAELSPGIVCPLTSLENFFAQKAGIATYDSDFVTRYLVPVIYQDGVSPLCQILLVVAVLALNAFAYLLPRKTRPTLSWAATKPVLRREE
jgi:hypothetical protein